MRVLVTGAAGFIGSHFLDCFQGPAREVAACIDKITYASSREALQNISMRKIPWYHADIKDTSTVIRAIIDHDVDLVVNFAAETHVDNSIRDCRPFVESNVNGILSILEACRMTKTRLLHISTDEVYGPAGDIPFKENDKLSPKNPYAATKAAAEHLIDSYRNTFGVQALIVRPTNNFGPRQNFEKFMPKYINSVATNTKFPLYGDGLQEREWFYVKDCARMIRDLAEKWVGYESDVRCVNIGSPDTLAKNIDVCRSLFNKISIESTLPCSEEKFLETIQFVLDRPGHDKKYSIDVGGMQIMLPNFKFTPFEEAANETVSHYWGSIRS